MRRTTEDGGYPTATIKWRPEVDYSRCVSHPEQQDPAGPRPPWAGAPGYQPFGNDLPPHAPMPGAPPYPAGPEHPAPAVGRPAGRTSFLAALGAAAVWAVVNLALVLGLAGPPPGAGAAGAFVGRLLLPTLFAALCTWLIARRRGWSFWLLVLLAAPFFWVLRALTIGR